MTPLEALRQAIETYLALRPEMKLESNSPRSLQKTAAVLQTELLEKQAIHGSVEDELTRLQARLDTTEVSHVDLSNGELLRKTHMQIHIRREVCHVKEKVSATNRKCALCTCLTCRRKKSMLSFDYGSAALHPALIQPQQGCQVLSELTPRPHITPRGTPLDELMRAMQA